MVNNQAGGLPSIKSIQVGRVPSGSLAMLEQLRGFILEAAFSNELKLGQLPGSSTKATSIVEAQQAIAGVFGGLVRIFEDKFIVPIIEKSWMTILQEMDGDKFLDRHIVSLIGAKKAQELSKLSPEERFTKGSMAGKIKVRGISGFVNRLREFQKLTNLLGVIGSNELLLGEFQKEYSIGQFLQEIIKSTGIREDSLRLSDQEKQAKEGVQALLNQALAGAQGANPGGNGSPSGETGGSPESQTDLESLPPTAEVPLGAQGGQ